MPGSEALELTTRVMRREDSIFADSGGETVMMNLATNNYYGLDPIGSRIWEILAQPVTVAAICDKLRQEYEVEIETCQRDVMELLQELIDEQLVQTVNI